MISAIIANAIHMENGIISFDEYNCTVYVNSEEQRMIGKEVENLQFGVIRYMCPSSSGVAVSKLSCHKCGFYCAQNDLVEGCNGSGFPFVVGFLIGLLASAIPIFLMRKVVRSMILKWFHWGMYMCQLRDDKKVEKETARVEKVLNTNMVSNYNEPRKLPRHLMDKIENRRTTRHCRKAQALALLALSASAPLSEACDKTLFVSSSGVICQNDRCIDNTMISLSLQVGNHICMKSYDGEKTEIRVVESYYRMRYTHEYDTMDYDLNINSHWECKQLLSDCWNGGCLPNEVHSKYKKTNDSLTRHGCMVGSLGCDTWCISQTSCSWYEAKLIPKDVTMKVMRYQSKIWEVKLEVSRRGYTIKQFLNSNNPLLNVNDIGEKNRTIPMVINSVLTEEYNIPEYLLLHGNKAYDVDASSKNYPMLGRFGDIQKNTKGAVIFPMDDLKVSLRACKVYGELKESQISRFLRTIDNYSPVNYNQIVQDKIVEIRQPIGATYNFMMQLDNFKSLEHSPTNCEYEVVSTFACSECNKKPHVVLHPIKVSHKGILGVSSNCSLDTSVIACGPEPITISFNGLPTICSLSMNSLNTTISISFDYIYKGNLNSMESRLVYGTTEDIKSLATNMSFITGIMSSVTTIASLSVVATILLQAFKLYQLNKTENKISRV